MNSTTYNAWQQPPPPGTQPPYCYPAPIPAYHPVQVRQSFATPPPQTLMAVQPPAPIPTPSATSPSNATTRPKVIFSQAVREYVQRSFEPQNLLTDIPRAEIEAKLKQTITEATENNMLETRDWAKHPLPQEMIRQERQAALSWQQESIDLRNGLTNSSKKRKSQNMEDYDKSNAIPPWHANNRIEDRISFDKRIHPTQDDSYKQSSKSQKNLEKRQKRFGMGPKLVERSPSPGPSMGPVVGTCQTLEKNYFRLTCAPIPAMVRPEPVLRKNLDLLKRKWRTEGKYAYICDQFKSMRQDIVVQGIRNEFTVTVYEIHARIALEKGDLGEYNQCQTMLRALYDENLGGNPVEFKAYRILYFIHTANRTALNDVLADLTTADKTEKAIKHALEVRSTLALGNYHKFFRLYLEVPNMGAYLMDMFVVRERLAALANICKAYKPDVSLRLVTEELGFESDQATYEFIEEYGGKHLLTLAQDESTYHFLAGKAGQLFEEARKQAFSKVDIKGQI